MMRIFGATLAALLLAAPARAADVVELTATSVAAPPEKPLHSSANPCDRSAEGERAPEELDDDLYPEKKSCAGQTRARLAKGLKIDWSGRDGAEGEALLFAESVRVKFVLEQTLLVSSDYAKDTCPYKVTLEHEGKHWKDNVRIHEKTAKALLAAVRAIVPTSEKPARQPRKQAVIDAYFAQMKAKIGDLIKAHGRQFRDEAAAAVAVLDDAKSYDKEYSLCPAKDWKAKAP